MTCTATDAANNGADPTTFTVTVQDTTDPVIAAHADVTVEATGPAGAIDDYTPPSVTDAGDGPGVAECTPASGTQFAIGDTVVICDYTDSVGNEADQTTFTVHVLDTTGPAIAAHADVAVAATDRAGANVTYSAPTTTDAVDGAGVATCAPPSGMPLRHRRHDDHLQPPLTPPAMPPILPPSSSRCVGDAIAPVIADHADATAEATGAAGALVQYQAPATSDNVDGPGTAVCAPGSGSQFALGDTTVTCSATDAAGNAAAPTTFIVTVRDTTAPVIAAHDAIATEGTSAGALVIYTAPTTSDAVDGSGLAVCTPASGSQFVLGDTTVTCTATDAAGNASTPTQFLVSVVRSLDHYWLPMVTRLAWCGRLAAMRQA